MAYKLGINWYSRLQQKIAHLEHQLEDTGKTNHQKTQNPKKRTIQAQ